MTERKVYDLQERFIEFALAAIQVSSELDTSRVSLHLGGQLLRSGTAPALLYAEAMGAESRKDFIHKLKLVIKELRESSVSMRILSRANKMASDNPIHKECGELIAITTKSIQTATKNLHTKA
jgi:four helix bundle protein